MKKSVFAIIVSSIILFSCDTNTKLKQENALKAIMTFITENAYKTHMTLEVYDWDKIEPITQFSKDEASLIYHFQYKDSYTNETLTIKFIFKRNIDKQWILTSLSPIAGVGSQFLSDALRQFQDINILAQ